MPSPHLPLCGGSSFTRSSLDFISIGLVFDGRTVPPQQLWEVVVCTVPPREPRPGRFTQYRVTDAQSAVIFVTSDSTLARKSSSQLAWGNLMNSDYLKEKDGSGMEDLNVLR